jgi:hypothetical protein
VTVFLAAALSGPAFAQDSGHGAGPERGGPERGGNASRSSPGGSWADEVRSAIGGRSNRGGEQGGDEALVRSDMQTGSTGKGAPGKPDK